MFSWLLSKTNPFQFSKTTKTSLILLSAAALFIGIGYALRPVADIVETIDSSDDDLGEILDEIFGKCFDLQDCKIIESTEDKTSTEDITSIKESSESIESSSSNSDTF